MSIELPQLDDTSYDELVSRAKQLIAARSETWTDFNPHDPGITIVELLAWLTETHIYEADQITDAHRRKYLQLLGVEPRPPQPASVTLTLSPSAGQSGRLPAGTELRVDDGQTRTTFRTDRAVSVSDADLAAVVSQTDHGTESHTDANNTAGMWYRPFGDRPTAGTAAAFGFDGDPFGDQELTLFVGFHDAELPEPAPTETGVEFEPSVDLVWEYCRKSDENEDEGSVEWEPLTVLEDTTNSFYGSGIVRLERPDSWTPPETDRDEVGLFGQDPGLRWLRCRLRRGGYEIPPQCETIGLNVVEASHRSQCEGELTPKDEGPPGSAPRTYEFDRTPVLSATVSVDGEPWTEVADFDGSGPGETQYVLDRTAGELTVGDGQRGARPPVGATVTARYTVGGGTEGNVAERATWSFIESDRPLGEGTLGAVQISARGAATGGRAAEPLSAAIDRCQRELTTSNRAVTAEEYGTVAAETPGLRTARTTVLLPDDPGEPVSVVVLPYAPPDVDRPTPSEGFRAAVEQQLDRHRLLGDRIEVRAPTYVGLRLRLSVTVAGRDATGTTNEAIERQLESYLDPIRGFEGEGWPFGRSLSNDELRAAVCELPAVEDVEELSIRTVGEATVTAEGSVLIDDSTLFVLEDVQVETHSQRSNGGGR